jgi:hypothetical protein
MDMPPKTDRRFFDPREPGRRRKNAAEMCARFNELYPEGTAIRVYPLARWLEDCKKETVVKYPGAFMNASGCAVVKIPGDCIALTHVQII